MLDDMPVPWCLSRRRHYLPEPQGGIVFHTHEYCVAIGGLPVRYRTFMPTSRVYVRVFHAMQFDTFPYSLPEAVFQTAQESRAETQAPSV